MQKYYAHSIEGKPVEEWHGLEEHLIGIAILAKEFAVEFGSGDWAYLAGLWYRIFAKVAPRVGAWIETYYFA